MPSSATASKSVVVTYPYIEGESDQTLYASVVGANPTATTLVIECFSGDYCPYSNATYTYGPWAQITPPPDASTGVFDMRFTTTYGEPDNTAKIYLTGTDGKTITGVSLDSYTQTYSMHCQLTNFTVPTVCTTTDIDAWSLLSTLKPTATITDPDFVMFTPLPITITAGLEKLAATTASASHGSGSGTGSAASTTAAASHSNAGTRMAGADMGSLGLVGLVMAFLLR
ncbi:hypothetical protein ANO11243_016890 [Dothideomycetidae sp. 11243]|nr:hypothetical protein ANO11243_016890 [fungal sp. No.11243]